MRSMRASPTWSSGARTACSARRTTSPLGGTGMRTAGRWPDVVEIRGGIELPARREDVTLQTADGLTLVGELALPETRDPVATLVTLHPLPTAGGFMDSHVLRKAAARLPALADLAVLRVRASKSEVASRKFRMRTRNTHAIAEPITTTTRMIG